MAILVAIALGLVAILLRGRATAVAWIAAALGALIAAVEIVGALRNATLLSDAGSNLVGLTVAVVVLAIPAALATWFAAGRRGRASSPWERILVAGAVGSFLVLIVAATWALAQGATGASALASGDTAPVRVAGRLALVAVAVGLLVGSIRDGTPILRRGWSTWRAQDATDPGRPFFRHLAEAATPGRTIERRGAADAERARLAADLHALVLPDLRRAAAAASADSVPDVVRTGVQRALEDVEQLMHGRQNIVLDEFGLVAALEWLAERAEAAAPPLRVEVELVGERIDDRAAVPGPVAGAAFRIALLALDNVVRHAHANVASLGLRVTASSVELSISDDGATTIAERRSPARDSGRGSADMRREAATSGGTLRTTPPPSARVTVTWTIRGAA
ncbi:MAG TPA: hypothetical protein VM451_05145 [Candidatus Limnocylindria bacterium]|nr:hypothetical protein [Candidatus Limnocylindria bacterium]